jgi:hypothetical protein
VAQEIAQLASVLQEGGVQRLTLRPTRWKIEDRALFDKFNPKLDCIAFRVKPREAECVDSEDDDDDDEDE